MNIIITGCLGHIGSYIISKLSKINNLNKVYLLDNNTQNKLNTLFNIKTKKKIIYIDEDLSEARKLFKIKDIDVIIHLASTTNAEASLNNSKSYFNNNIGCFKNILKYCKKNKSKLIHISSTSVYGDQSDLVNEKSKKLKPQSPYAKIKLIEEKMLRSEKNLKFITLRFGTIAGFSNGMRYHTAVNKFCYQTIMKKDITVWKTAMNQFRPYLSIHDAFKSINFIIKKNLFINQIFNVLSENLTVNDILKVIKINGYKIKIKKVKSKIMNQLSYKVDKKKFEKLGIKLNYKIKNDIKDTLKSLSSIKNAK